MEHSEAAALLGVESGLHPGFPKVGSADVDEIGKLTTHPSQDSADDTELMVRVVEEVGVTHQTRVDYDAFQQRSGRPNGSPTPPDSENIAKDDQSGADEPEWLFLGSGQKPRPSGSNMSAETSQFIMKRSSVRDCTEDSTTTMNLEGVAAAAVVSVRE